MLVSSEFFVLVVTTLAAVAFCYPLILLKAFTILRRPEEKAPDKQLEQKLLSCHQNSLEKMEKQTRTEIKEGLAAMASKHAETLVKLEKAVKGGHAQTHQGLKAATDEYLKETRLALNGVVNRAEKCVDDELTKELKAALAEVKSYKERQLKKVDEEIAAIVEKTIYLTLGKGLSPKDQVNIIYESLAEAKEEGFFGKNAS